MPNLARPVFVWGPMLFAIWLGGGDADAQTMRTMTSARQVWGTEPIDIEVVYGAGTLRIGAAEKPFLYQMELHYDEDTFTPVVEFDEEDRELRLGIRSPEGVRRSLNVREGSTATIGLTREVPIDLDLEFGAGKADIQLGGLSLRSISLATGASETVIAFDSPNVVSAERVSIEAGAADLRVTGLANARAERISFKGGVGATVLDFGGEWQHSATATVEMGVGSLTLQVPRGHGIRINRSSFLTSFSATDLSRDGDSYFSPEWAGATHRLTIDVSAALGSVEVKWID